MFTSNSRAISFLFFILADLISLAGVLVMGWSSIKVSLFYWLDALVMMFFLPFIASKISKRKLDYLRIFPAMIPLLIVFCFYYFLLVSLGEKMGYKIDHGQPLHELIYPYYEFPVILVAIVLEHIHEYKYFLRDPNEDAAVSAAKGFVFRILMIQAIICVSMIFISKHDQAGEKAFIPVVIIILFKTIIFYSHKPKGLTG